MLVGVNGRYWSLEEVGFALRGGIGLGRLLCVGFASVFWYIGVGVFGYGWGLYIGLGLFTRS